jgi:cob(I)alamin adenosyltransferase
VVRLTKIYTRTGDRGETGLGDGARVPKHDARVCAYGDVDEANSVLGLAAAACDDTLRKILAPIQNDLFDVGADLATPVAANEEPGSRLRVTPAQCERLERLIDEFNERLAPLESFVLPGGSEAAARLHVARAAVRRAERSVAALMHHDGTVGEQPLIYLNRLSDLLFVLARVANDDGRTDVLWKPGASQGDSSGGTAGGQSEQ